MNEDEKTFFEKIESLLGEVALSCSFERGEFSCVLTKQGFLRALTVLRDHGSVLLNQLMDLTVVDFLTYAPKPPSPGNLLPVSRFQMVYHLLSMTHNRRIRLKVNLNDAEDMPSITSVFKAANWYEREAFDLYGVVFTHHPDLRRILTDYNFDGYPLRKDFPLSGHVQVRYDDALKRVVHEPVSLTQEYRDFSDISPWEGMLDAPMRGNKPPLTYEKEGSIKK